MSAATRTCARTSSNGTSQRQTRSASPLRREGSPSDLPTGFNIEGLEFAPASKKKPTSRSALRWSRQHRTEALVIPVKNFGDLVNHGNPGPTKATFGSALEWNLGGLGIREIRENAAGEYLIVAGTPDGTDDQFRMYSWDGVDSDQPVVSPTPLAEEAGGSWESIVTAPASLVTGGSVELVEDNGDTAWYGDLLTSKTGLATGLQKDLGQTFTFISGVTPPLAPATVSAVASTDGSGSIAVNWAASTDDDGSPLTGYVATATPSGAGAPVTQTLDPGTTSTTFTGLTLGTSYTVTVASQNQAGLSSATVAPGGPFVPALLSFTSPSAVVVAAGKNMRFKVTTVGNPAMTISVQSGLPAWLTFTPGRKAGKPAELSGRAPADGGGEYQVTLAASCTVLWSSAPMSSPSPCSRSLRRRRSRPRAARACRSR